MKFQVLVATVACALAGFAMAGPLMKRPTGNYCGSSDGMWNSDVNITSDKEFTITVTGPHSGNVPHSTCHNVGYNMSSNGDFDIPDSWIRKTCYWYLRTGNNYVLTLTYSSSADTILLGVADPSTDITMSRC